MSPQHELKTWPEPFQAMWDGKKTCEVRKNDRGYAVGQILLLHEWDPTCAGGTYMGRALTVEVTHIVHGGKFGLPDDLVVMSVREKARHDIRDWEDIR